MAKVKVPRKSTSVDMTAMTDVAFLLLTFFMLATQFKPDEPVQVLTPSSVAEIPLPDVDVMLITISNDNRVFFDLQGEHYKKTLLDKMSKKFNVTFTDDEKKKFSDMSSFGLPFAQLKQYINLSSEKRKELQSTGIPYDSLNNELSEWVWQSRLTNNGVRVAIKGDRDVSYPAIKQVINTLQQRDVNRFNFITSMEGAQ
ncbi:MAG: biopolymer transporter ExbD [Bacteroidota bacterium]|jgi:biopolymer transport protein ExbD